MTNYKGPIVNSPEVRAARAAAMREWRNRPENLERARAGNRASRQRAIEREGEAYHARQRERYRTYISSPEARAKKADSQRTRQGAGLYRRRGLNRLDRHDYWVSRAGLCDFCGSPYPDPLLPGAWKDAVVDHDREHCDRQIGCRECVRAQGHRACNVMEGVVRAAVARGLISGYWGRLNDILTDPPMQRWLATRTT